MQPSSLIFVVIVAIWAAYLVQHWVRRREHLSTARSVDRFSEALRVLNRRPVSAVRTGGGRSGSMLAMAGGTTVGELRPEPPVSVGAAADRESASGEVSRESSGVRQTRPQWSSQRRWRLARGMTLLGALASVPVAIVLSLLDVLAWVSVLVAIGAVAACVAGLRLYTVSARRRSRSAVERGGGSTSGARTFTTSAGAGSTTTRAGSSTSRTDAASARLTALAGRGRGVLGSAGSALGAAVAGLTSRLRGARQGTEQASETTDPTSDAARAAQAGIDTDAIPVGSPEPHRETTAAEAAYRRRRERAGTWEPVPVPRPTYLLKDRAVRPEPVVASEPVTEPAAVAEPTSQELDPPRRAAVGG